MIALSPVQTQTFIHNVILFIDMPSNAWCDQTHWLIRTPYLSIIASNASINFFFSGVVEKIGILGIPTEYVNGYCKIVTNFPSKSIALFALFMNTSLQFFVPLLIIFCLYVHILVAVRRRSRQIASVTNQHQAQSQNIINQTTVQAKKMSNVAKNVTKTLMTVTLFFALCWSFNSVYFILAVEGSFGLTLSSQFYYVSSYLVCANQIINPFLYALQYKQFQAQTAKICCRGKCTKRNIIVVTEGTVSTQMTT